MELKKFIEEIVKEELQNENDIEVGHQDDEPGMIKQSAYEISKYALELYKMLDEYDKSGQEVDFPHWWQAKIVKARDYIGVAKHYLEFESKENDIK